ncbi:hypothetical protein [Salipiger sp. PrR003]|uniref:hypothetical protein n=1 Tax=Salipiger sp. PrR003 TaxID=2706776 RepID=UPI0013DD73F6|nr:hypothetical protein [Salipiger sp. PrR003]NDV52103.1 hypothetical protein [Salipiger sp. PrR003]
MPAWPSDLPFFESADETRTGPQGAVIRSQMDMGPDQVRRRTSSAPKRRAGVIQAITDAELVAFEAFFSNVIGEGALSFTATDPFDGVTRTFRFVGSYSVQRVWPYFAITAELEILP